METIKYDEYLPLRGEKIEPDQLIPGHTYYIEKNNEPENRRTVYRGIYLDIDSNLGSAIFNDKKGKSTIQFVVNPLKLKGEPFGFSIDPKWGNTFYTNSGEVNKNVRRLIYTLTRKRKNMIGPLPRGQTREMGLPMDVATIIALNFEDPHEISKTAKKIKSRKHHTSQSASKGGKKMTKKQRTKKH